MDQSKRWRHFPVRSETLDATREFDIVSPAFHSDPFPTLDRMRAEGAVVRITVPLLGRMWFAVPYDACATLLKDHESFARDPANAGSRTQARILRFLPRTIGLLALNMIGKDDPEHRRLRGLVDQAFQRRTIEAMKPHHAPPEPTPLFRHRCAFLPWFSTRSGGGRDRVRTHHRALSRYAPRD